MKLFIKNNNKEKKFGSGSSAADILKMVALDQKEFIIPKFNDTLINWDDSLSEDGTLEFLDFSSEEAQEVYRHTSSHIMAQAVKRLFPDVKVTIGPAIKDGFYYDFDVKKNFQDSDLEKIEEEIRKIIKVDMPFKKEVMPRKKAIELFKKADEPYKVELLNEIESKEVSVYKDGEFTDLCRGPHLESTGKIKLVKLLKISGAYWRGNEKNKMLQRIYGTSFPTKEAMDNYLDFLKESEERDHRKLGKQLDLYSIQEAAGPGLVYWHPAGALVRHLIETFWKEEHLKRGYEFIYSPHIAKIDLWKISGHWENYRENIYSPMEIDEQQYIIKPMNCPGHILIFKNRIRSYRELPVRWAELGTVYRYERSGVLHGMLRVRGFTQDDAHIFCMEEQLSEEITGVLDQVFFMLDKFGFSKYEINLSTRPDKFAGTEKGWEKATNSLKEALNNHKLKFEIDPGGGVFYGPKIDIKLVDALGRGWQGSTIQVDFVLPERFDMQYVGQDGKEHRPVMIHRALLGSFERFMGILIEHYKGAFPLWLAPTQVLMIPITENQNKYAKKIEIELKKSNIRVVIDDRNEKMGLKIREAITKKTPYLFIVGKNEENENKISVRSYKEGDLGQFSLDKMIKKLEEEIKDKKI
ncbi:MAG: threonine--tRNA ligase [Spirochaetes bacterium]|nr:threonine--tRNA ligase [Spirochaetota bacterium]